MHVHIEYLIDFAPLSLRRYADVGYHGSNVGSAVITPTIDELSSKGVRLGLCPFTIRSLQTFDNDW